MVIYHSLKLVSAILYQTFIFYQMVALQKLCFYFIQKALLVLRYSDFLFWPSPLFFHVSHCFRGWSKKNLKVYVVINCLNNNLITHFVWYLEKEITCDIGTLSIVREIRNIFMNKSHKKWNQKLGPDPILILLNNPKQPFHARSSFRNKIF